MTSWLTRKLATSCTYPGCPEPPLPDHCQCARHRDGHRERNKQSMRRTRAFRAAQCVLEGVG